MWVSVYLDLLSHFLPFKIHLTNISPILIKMVDFKNLAWATSFATQASRKFIYLPYRASGKKSYCHTLFMHWWTERWCIWFVGLLGQFIPHILALLLGSAYRFCLCFSVVFLVTRTCLTVRVLRSVYSANCINMAYNYKLHRFVDVAVVIIGNGVWDHGLWECALRPNTSISRTQGFC